MQIINTNALNKFVQSCMTPLTLKSQIVTHNDVALDCMIPSSSKSTFVTHELFCAGLHDAIIFKINICHARIREYEAA